MRSSTKSLARLAFAALLVAFAGHADAASGPWETGAKARVRLVAAGVGPDAVLNGVIEIAMPPGWKTYWRNPGTAGIAPEFDFSASRNMKTPVVDFPVPHVVDDGYSVTNVYQDGVMLPFRALVDNPREPVDVALTLRLGVCEEVCIPDEVTAAVTVLPGEDDPDAVQAILAARAKVPGPAEPGVLAVDSLAREGGTEGRPVFRMAATVPAGTKPQVFVEGPADWAPYAPVAAGTEGGKALFDLKFSRLGAETPISGASIRITLVAGGRAVEQTIALD